MRAIKTFAVLFAGIFSLQFSYAQAPIKKESFKVYGNCGMCKKTIESSAKAAGVTFANWNTKTKQLDVTYDPSVTNSIKIQETIAAAGYDTRDYTGDDSAYSQLPECCQYVRKQTAKSKNN